ncbi:MAG TPA: ATP-binding protein [Candidatus Limnocylindrales bacterium]|nr:ATP-binding protein [Candidatus Limnocylindrales bacterium]
MNRGGDRISTRFLVAALGVAALVLAIVAVGVLRVGATAFEAVMMAAGESAEHAHAMFDESVTGVFLVAAAVAVVTAVGLAMLLARRLALPIERLAAGAARIADGDLDARVPENGPAELRALAEAYNRMAERLAQQEAVRREFIVNASHELKTPLTNLQGYLEALRDGVIPPEPATFDSLREEVDRLTRLAASLDVLAGADGAGPGARVVDLGSIVRSSVDLVAPALARRSIAMELDAPDGLAVRAHPDELTQVLANLLQNAVRYTPRDGRVRVIVDRDGALARVRVANTGPGIPPEDLPRVWERFYRVEKSRDRERGGAGIGLAIVKQLVESVGGRVGVVSGGGWTEFTVLLPA